MISPRADGVEVELSITPLAEGLLKVTACNTGLFCVVRCGAVRCGVVWCVVCCDCWARAAGDMRTIEV